MIENQNENQEEKVYSSPEYLENIYRYLNQKIDSNIAVIGFFEAFDDNTLFGIDDNELKIEIVHTDRTLEVKKQFIGKVKVIAYGTLKKDDKNKIKLILDDFEYVLDDEKNYWYDTIKINDENAFDIRCNPEFGQAYEVVGTLTIDDAGYNLILHVNNSSTVFWINFDSYEIRELNGKTIRAIIISDGTTIDNTPEYEFEITEYKVLF